MTSPDVAVRGATTEDLRSLEPILPAFLRPPYKYGRFVRAVANGEVVVLSDGTALAGFLWTTEFFGHSFVNVLAVATTHRRRGFAGLLLAHAERGRLTDRVFTSTNASNAAMHAVLARYGWRRCGEVDDLDPGDPEIVYVKYPAGTTEHRVRLSDGAQTLLQRWGDHGPLVVGVHGLGASRRGWQRIAEHLAGRYRVVAYDQRGHGDHSAKGPMAFERSVDDLADVVASLDEPVHALVGHSWGGAAVIEGGRRLNVNRVAAIDPMMHVAPGVWSAGARAEYRSVFELTLEEREEAVRASNAALPQVEIDAKLHAARRLTLEPIEALGDENEIDEGGWDLRDLVRDYPKPLLLALADPKRTVVLADQRELFRAIGGPNVRIEVFAGASHSLQRDAFDRFMPVLEAFLD